MDIGKGGRGKERGGGHLIKGGRGFDFDEGDETREHHIEEQRCKG